MDIGGALRQWLGSLAPGGAGCVFAEDVVDVRNVLEATATSQSAPARVVTLTWNEVPPLANELGLIVSSLARATLNFFPALYGLTQEPRSRFSEAVVEGEAHDAVKKNREVHAPTCRKILAACHRGQVPQLGKMLAAEQVQQLALAIDQKRLVVIITVVETPLKSEAIRSLSQGAEWLAANTSSRVVLVLPRALEGHPALDHVSYASCLFVEPERPSRHRTEPPPLRLEAGPALTAATEARDAVPEVGTSPILGRPAPRSDAENHLYSHLCRDPELAPLFGYNLRVQTRFDTTPIIDVLWADGRLAIEIDGSDHRGATRYSMDRRRDYELTLSDYTVLRFSSGRVIEFASIVVEEIREAVRHIVKRSKRP